MVSRIVKMGDCRNWRTFPGVQHSGVEVAWGLPRSGLRASRLEISWKMTVSVDGFLPREIRDEAQHSEVGGKGFYSQLLSL